MKKFIVKVFVFLVILLVILFLPSLIESKDNRKYNLNQKIRTVFVGDSHVQLSINDKLITNAFNFAINSEATYFSYYKIGKLINENPNLKKVYLGFSPHNISSYYDGFIYGEYSKNIMPRYFDLLPTLEKQKYRPSEPIVFYKYYLKTKIFGTESGYRNRFKNATAVKKSMDKRIKFQYFNDSGDLMAFSKINIEYLRKIQDLASNHKIELVILDVPVHPYYDDMVPEEYKKKYNEIIKNSQVVKINLEEITLDEGCFIPDGDHLSEKGAKILSNYLNNREE